MKIKTITSQNRRDFNAIYVCEHCGAEEKGSGYDDNYFHREVVPKMKCASCGESSVSLGVTIEQRATKYPEFIQL